MGMTIEEIQQGLKAYHNGFTGCAGNFQEVVDGALDVVCRYQKIKQILKDIPYGGDATVTRIQEVVEDGKRG